MRNISLTEFQGRCMSLAKKIPVDKYSSLYAVPSRGIPVAMELSKITGIPLQEDYMLDGCPDKRCLIVNDLIDDGTTRNRFIDNDFACLFIKIDSDISISNIYYESLAKNEWIHFFWEKKNENMEDNVERILQYLGEDVKREGLIETPKRIVNSWKELYSGYSKSPEDVIKTFASDGYDEIVMLKDIEFYSTCEHHMLPFFGKAHIAYIPDKRVIGISKLARLLDIYARRLQIQERIGQQVTEVLMNELKAIGASCVIEATHFCMRSRGIQKQNSIMTTSSLKGIFLENSTKGLASRNELMRLIHV